MSKLGYYVTANVLERWYKEEVKLPKNGACYIKYWLVLLNGSTLNYVLEVWNLAQRNLTKYI